MRLGRLSMLVVALTVVTGCATNPASPPTPERTEREVATGCRREAEPARPVHFDNVDGGRLGGLIVGAGPVGVVLVHQIDATLCQWLPYGKRLATRGFQVLVMDLGGYGSSEPSAKPDQDVKQAVRYLRQQGAQTIVLIGASLGGTASLSAAVIVQPPVDAVVSLSGPLRAQGMDLSVRIRALASPVLYVAGTYDGTFDDDAQMLYDATLEERKQLVLVRESSHGVQLIDNPEVAAAMDEMLDRLAPARA
jgi:pimeloyl-ACP methyl ester carboxylesterase